MIHQSSLKLFKTSQSFDLILIKGDNASNIVPESFVCCDKFYFSIFESGFPHRVIIKISPCDGG